MKTTHNSTHNVFPSRLFSHIQLTPSWTHDGYRHWSSMQSISLSDSAVLPQPVSKKFIFPRTGHRQSARRGKNRREVKLEGMRQERQPRRGKKADLPKNSNRPGAACSFRHCLSSYTRRYQLFSSKQGQGSTRKRNLWKVKTSTNTGPDWSPTTQ